MFQSKYCEIYYFKKENVLLLQWKMFCQGEDYKKPLRFAVKELKNRRNSNIIIDVRNGFEPDKEDAKWLFEKLIPQMRKTDLQRIIFVASQKKHVVQAINKYVSKFETDFQVKQVSSIEDAFYEFSDESKQPIVLNITYIVKPGKREEFYNKVSEEGIPKLSREEPGNMRYEYFTPTEQENELILIEIWRNQDALDGHKEMEHFKKLQALKEEYILDTRFETYAIVN
jgi:quinol monooxygenase YgiN